MNYIHRPLLLFCFVIISTAAMIYDDDNDDYVFWEYIGKNNVIRKCGRGFDDMDEDYEEDAAPHMDYKQRVKFVREDVTKKINVYFLLGSLISK